MQQDQVLTWFAFKVATVIGIVFGSLIQPKVNPYFLLTLIPGFALYFDERAMYGVAALYAVASVYMKYYTWAMYTTSVSIICITLPLKIQAAPLVAITAPVVFGFIYFTKHESI